MRRTRRCRRMGLHESDSGNLPNASEGPAGVTVKFMLRDNAQTIAMWPHAFALELEMRLGAEMHLALRMRNTGDTPFTTSGALHNYFAVGDIEHVAVKGLDGVEYLDTVGA